MLIRYIVHRYASNVHIGIRIRTMISTINVSGGAYETDQFVVVRPLYQQQSDFRSGIIDT